MKTEWAAHEDSSFKPRNFDTAMRALYGLEVPNHNKSYAVSECRLNATRITFFCVDVSTLCVMCASAGPYSAA